MVRLVAVMVGAALALAGCDDPAPRATEATQSPSSTGSVPGSTTTVVPTATTPTTTAEANVLPDVVMRDVAAGDEVNLRSLAGRSPILFWFWAPH